MGWGRKPGLGLRRFKEGPLSGTASKRGGQAGLCTAHSLRDPTPAVLLAGPQFLIGTRCKPPVVASRKWGSRGAAFRVEGKGSELCSPRQPTARRDPGPGKGGNGPRLRVWAGRAGERA